MNKSDKLAISMMVSMVLGISCGLGFMAFREYVGSDSLTWQMINNFMFQDITSENADSAVGIFFIGGQLFIRSLQLIIVPMIFSSIVVAICEIQESTTLGRLSAKTIKWFLVTSGIALILAVILGAGCNEFGIFNVAIEGVEASAGKTGSNPLNVILNIIPSNVTAVFAVNNAVLSVVFLAIVVGLSMNKLGLKKDSALYKLCTEISAIIVTVLNFVVTRFGPIAIFMLLCRAFAIYGVGYLKPAVAYVVICVLLLLFYLFIGYPAIIAIGCKLNPYKFIQKIFKVIVFGFSTSSSAATLPLNMDTTVKDMGVDKKIAAFVLPLGMTINMDGTAIMQIIATFFIAGCGGFDVNVLHIVAIMLLALIASVGTPAAPGAGAVILFTVLSGVGFTNEPAMIAYSLILAINRPIEMLVTALNCVGDSVVAIVVAKSECKLDEYTYNA